MNTLLNGILLSLLLGTGVAQAKVVVIANPLGPDSLSQSQVSKLYLGKSKHLPNQGRAFVIEMADESGIKDEFHSKVTHKNAAQLQAYWSRLIFTGKGKPPHTVRSSELVLSLVGSKPNAIGYVDEAFVDDRVNVVYRP